MQSPRPAEAHDALQSAAEMHAPVDDPLRAPARLWAGYRTTKTGMDSVSCDSSVAPAAVPPGRSLHDARDFCPRAGLDAGCKRLCMKIPYLYFGG